MVSETPKLLDRSKDYLVVEFETRKKRRPAYSLRAFSRDLGISPSSVVDLLKDRAGFSKARADKVAQILKLDASEQDHFWDLLQKEYSHDYKVKHSAKARIDFRIKNSPIHFSSESFKAIADWYHLAILEIIDVTKGEISEAALADTLKLKVSVVAKGIQRLKNLGLLVEKNSKLMAQSDWSNIRSDESMIALRQFHKQVLALALTALNEQDYKSRESYSAFVSVKAKNYQNFRDELCQAIDKVICKYGSENDRDQVIGLSLQTFKVFKK